MMKFRPAYCLVMHCPLKETKVLGTLGSQETKK